MDPLNAKPIDIAEMLWRRIDPMYCRAPKNQGKPPSIRFFTPRSADVDGLSISRASISPTEVACKAASGKEQALAEFATRFVCSLGMTVSPQPTNVDVGHAVIPELNYRRMRSSEEEENIVLELANAIAEASVVVWQPPVDGL